MCAGDKDNRSSGEEPSDVYTGAKYHGHANCDDPNCDPELGGLPLGLEILFMAWKGGLCEH